MVMWSNGTTMTLDKTKNPTAIGYIFNAGASTTGTTNVMFATAKYGNGKVAAIGDSSPPDDGTGGSGNSLYNGYTGDVGVNHQNLIMNATIWLATHKSKTTAIEEINANTSSIKIYPNPTTNGKMTLDFSESDVIPSSVQLIDLNGKILETATFSTDFNGLQVIDVSHFRTGMYLCKIIGNKTSETKLVRISN